MSSEKQTVDQQPDNPQEPAHARPGTAAQSAAMKQIAALLEAWMRRECTTPEGAAKVLATCPSRLIHMREGRFDLLSLDELADMLGRACAARFRKTSR